MPVNTVLQFALKHENRTRAILIGYFGLRGPDVDDASQEVALRLLGYDLERVDFPKALWWTVVRSVAMDFFRQRRRAPVHNTLEDGAWLEDRRQDPAAALETREQLASAMAAATPRQRQALAAMLDDLRPLTVAERVHLCRLRQKLRAGAMA